MHLLPALYTLVDHQYQSTDMATYCLSASFAASNTAGDGGIWLKKDGYKA